MKEVHLICDAHIDPIWHECKFLVFTDLHYSRLLISADANVRLTKIMERAITEKVAFVMQLGDFLHEPNENGWLAGTYWNYDIPTYSAIGNHDTDCGDVSEVISLYHMSKNYYYFEEKGYRFIVLDPNYGMIQNVVVHYGTDQRRPNNCGYLPQEQLEWLEKTIAESDLPCILFSHESLERTDGIINRDDAWKIICAANRHRVNSVILCVNGHYHNNACGFVNDVCCLDLNSASYHWTDEKNNYYPVEWYEKYSLTANCIGYDTALSAILTLKGNKEIVVNGCMGGFLFSPNENEIRRLDQRRLSDSRICVPYIGNYVIDLQTQKICQR